MALDMALAGRARRGDTAGRRGVLGCSGCGCAGGSGICGAPAEMMGVVSPRQLATPVARADRSSPRGSWRVTVPPVETCRSGAPRPALSEMDSEMLPPISAIGQGKRAFPAAAAASAAAALPALAAAADKAGESKRRQPLAQSSIFATPPVSSWTSCALKRSAVKTTPSALSSGSCTVRRSNVARSELLPTAAAADMPPDTARSLRSATLKSDLSLEIAWSSSFRESAARPTWLPGAPLAPASSSWSAAAASSSGSSGSNAT